MRILMTRMQMQKQQDEMSAIGDQQLKKDKKIALQLSLAHTPDNDDMSASDKNALQMQEQRMQKEAGSARRKEKKDLQKAFNLSKKEKSMQGRNGDAAASGDTGHSTASNAVHFTAPTNIPSNELRNMSSQNN